MFAEEVRSVFAERTDVAIEHVYVRWMVVYTNLVVVVDIVVPPNRAPQSMEHVLRSDLLEVDENLNNAIAPAAISVGLHNAVVTNISISERSVIASPPPPLPPHAVSTDRSLIYITVASCVVLILTIVLFRMCTVQ